MLPVGSAGDRGGEGKLGHRSTATEEMLRCVHEPIIFGVFYARSTILTFSSLLS